MSTEEILTLNILGAESNNELSVIVRAPGLNVGLCLSIVSDGDVEAFLSLTFG